MTDEQFKNRVGSDRITSRQVDELVGLARGVAADGTLNQAEVEFLKSGWRPTWRSVINQ